MTVKILTHGDADGICAAAIAKARFPKAEIWFTRPVSLLDDLREVQLGDTVVITDIAIDESRKEQIFERMRELARRGEVIFIDHHHLPPNTIKKDVPATKLVNEIGVSASELAFKLFQRGIGQNLDRIALIGSIVDYLEDSDFVRAGLNKYDHRTIYFEACILSQALSFVGSNYGFKRDVVVDLSKGRLPSGSPELVDRAIKGTEREYRVWDYVSEHVEPEGNIAFVYDLPSGSPGKAALYALGITGADVGMCTRESNGKVDVSVRRRVGAKLDLNVLLRHITARVGGSGGGHEGAAGATIPAESFKEFIRVFKHEVFHPEKYPVAVRHGKARSLKLKL